jgi:cyclic pyranopterin phosphate synthase
LGKLTHLDEKGRARMVDVGEKAPTRRSATARGEVVMTADTLGAIVEGGIAKGDVLATARIAGITGGKKTPDLIPLTHPIGLDSLQVELTPDDSLPGVIVEATATTHDKTGVEMEALTAVSIAALTVYDMVKAIEKGVRISNIRLVSKTGGKSGDYHGE